jgi:hypothetical protein
MKSGRLNLLEPPGPVQGLLYILNHGVTLIMEDGVGENSRCAA